MKHLMMVLSTTEFEQTNWPRDRFSQILMEVSCSERFCGSWESTPHNYAYYLTPEGFIKRIAKPACHLLQEYPKIYLETRSGLHILTKFIWSSIFIYLFLQQTLFFSVLKVNLFIMDFINICIFSWNIFLFIITWKWIN